MKTKIAIFTRKLIQGGIEKALIEMLKQIDPTHYKVTVFVISEGGELFSQLPSWVEVKTLSLPHTTKLRQAYEHLSKGDFFLAVRCITFHLIDRSGWFRATEGIRLAKSFKKITEDFDYALSYHGPTSYTIPLVVNSVKAKKKILWVHEDIESHLEGIKFYKAWYGQYDKILCVSNHVANKFKSMVGFCSKVQTYYNHIDIEDIIEKSALYYPSEYKNINVIKLTTVARVSEEKGISLAIDVALKLKENNVSFDWFWVGDGNHTDALKKIKALDLEDTFHLLGGKSNPYPYIKYCDIYLQPSFRESFCLTISEAKILSKRIISTKTAGAMEQIQDQKNGLLTDFDAKDIFDKVMKVSNGELLDRGYEADISEILRSSVTDFDNLFGSGHQR